MRILVRWEKRPELSFEVEQRSRYVAAGFLWVDVILESLQDNGPN